MADGWSKWGTIGTWVAAVLAAIAVWETWPKSEVTNQGVANVSPWVIPSALIAALVLSGGLHLAATVIGRAKKKRDGFKPKVENHERCEITIANLNSKVRRLEESE